MGGTSSRWRSSAELYKVGTLAPPIAIGLLALRHHEAMQEPKNPSRDGSPLARTFSAMPRRHLASKKWWQASMAGISGDKSRAG